MTRPVNWMQAVNFIRANGPKTTLQVAEGLGCTRGTAGYAIRIARLKSTLKLAGKTDRGQFVFAAVQTVDWPAHNGE